MTVNKQKPIKFINETNCLVDYNELEKAILWYQERPTASNKKYICMVIIQRLVFMVKRFMSTDY